jgi:carboxyl-terminal processing protease
MARAVMGLFISRRLPFQRPRVEERNTSTFRDRVEYATPRLAEPCQGPARRARRGLDREHGGKVWPSDSTACRRGTVVGTQMAGLRGAVDSVDLPSLGCRAFFPTEQVFHVDGTPRHEWLPPVVVRPTSGAVSMQTAVNLLLKGSRRRSEIQTHRAGQSPRLMSSVSRIESD